MELREGFWVCVKIIYSVLGDLGVEVRCVITVMRSYLMGS